MARNYRKQGSTEPEEVTISATGLADLSQLNTATWHMRDVKTGVVKVDGGTMSVVDSPTRKLGFDPSGAGVDAGSGATDAFDEAGEFGMYTKCVWNDGDETRHPDQGYEVFVIEPNYE